MYWCLLRLRSVVKGSVPGVVSGGGRAAVSAGKPEEGATWGRQELEGKSFSSGIKGK